MAKLQEMAAEYFSSGFNCAQSVLSTYANRFNIDEELSKRISCGVGGGMGKLQETCGAVTGAIMVISLYNCEKYEDNDDRKAHTYSMVREFDARFKEIYGTTNCKSIIKTDINTEEGYGYAIDNNLFEEVCSKCVTDSVSILEDILPKQ